MKKFYLGVLLLIIVGCSFYKEEVPKGKLNFMINWPQKNISQNSNIMANILPETEKISIYLFKYNEENYNNSIEINKEIVRNGESEYLVTFNDLETGNWSIDIGAYNSSEQSLNFIYDNINIGEGVNIYTVFFGGPEKITSYSITPKDTTINLTSFSGIQFESVISNYNHSVVSSASYLTFDNINYYIYISTNSDMSNSVQLSTIKSSTQSGIQLKFDYATDFLYGNGIQYNFETGKTYYFKIRAMNSAGYIDSNIFSINFQ
jgi:hypothetical protein